MEYQLWSSRTKTTLFLTHSSDCRSIRRRESSPAVTTAEDQVHRGQTGASEPEFSPVSGVDLLTPGRHSSVRPYPFRTHKAGPSPVHRGAFQSAGGRGADPAATAAPIQSHAGSGHAPFLRRRTARPALVQPVARNSANTARRHCPAIAVCGRARDRGLRPTLARLPRGDPRRARAARPDPTNRTQVSVTSARAAHWATAARSSSVNSGSAPSSRDNAAVKSSSAARQSPRCR